MQDQPTAQPEPIDTTAVCMANRHFVCRGTVLSITKTHGEPCQCPCHDGDDLAMEASLERAHFEDL